MAKESSSAALNDESLACLSEVKKGKPRKFAMICKGTSIVSLVVYKKGNVEKRKKEAKEAGKGQFYFGAVDGKGTDIRFVLSRADGFESEPVKTTVLKSFLEEAADMKCKPYFEIVNEAQLVLDEDDPLVARFLKLQSELLKACDTYPDRAQQINDLCKQVGIQFDQDQVEEATASLAKLESILAELSPAGKQPEPVASPSTSSSPGPVVPPPSQQSETSTESTSSDATAQFMARLKLLKPTIDAAIAQPSANPDLKLRFSEAAVFARKREFETANRLLDQVEALIKSSPSDSTTGQVKSEDAAAQFVSRLKNLKPRIDAAIAAPNANPDIKLRFSEAAVYARKKEFGEASKLLDQVESLLDQAAKTSAPIDAPLDAAAQFMARLKLLKPRIDAAIAQPGANPDIRLRTSEAAVFARKKEYDSASQLLDQVEALLTQSSVGKPSVDNQPEETQPTPSTLSLVELGKARIEWDVARNDALGQINRLKKILASNYDGYVSEQKAHDANMARLDSIISALSEELGDRLDEVLNAEASQLQQLLPSAREVLNRFVKYIDSDELLQAIDGNEFDPTMLVAQPLRSHLQGISRAIGQG